MYNNILQGDALNVLRTLEPKSIDCCITSPPYWNLRDYRSDGQLGREKNYEDYIGKLLEIFDQVKRVLKDKGSCWIVIADSYGKNKSLLGIPERLIARMIDSSWILRSNIIWYKRNATPASAKNRFTPDWEYVLFFVKSENYYFKTQYEPHNPKYGFRYNSPFGGHDNKSGQGAFNYSKPRMIKPNPNGRIMRCMWDITIETYKGAHFAVFPEKLIERPILSTCPEGGICLDPFMGSGTTALVALKNARRFVGIELNKEYVKMAYDRIKPLLDQQTLLVVGKRHKIKCPRCGDIGGVSWQKGDRWNVTHGKSHKPWRCYMLTQQDKEKVKMFYHMGT